MLRLIIGFIGSQTHGPAKALYLGHSGVDAQKAVDAASGFSAVHVVEITHNRKARRSPGLPPVSEGAPVVSGESEDSELLAEALRENGELSVSLQTASGKLEEAVAALDALAKERDGLKKQVGKLEKIVAAASKKMESAAVEPAPVEEVPTAAPLESDLPPVDEAPGAPSI